MRTDHRRPVRMMKTGIALSIQQPWAWLIVNGHKSIENRTWDTGMRGRVGIHTGKKLDRDGLDWVRRTFPHIALPTSFDLGGIVGRAELTGVVTASNDPWFFGPFGFQFANAQPLPFMPCRGALGFFRPDIAFPRDV